ncbi:hypothetical protein TrLO_g14328 [Triparma laevis f. longispina]|uniref:Leucine-rich repeat domain-containing protein n=1 Tax=Triparma laevis f. longispina TaxID=1714387 RepID=A0A9W6ZFX4_9STRA|nr:hypothetical protein TrLO_g14328 [Triparma laevis f. longispina]
MSLSEFQTKLSKIRREEKDDSQTHEDPAPIWSAGNSKVTWRVGTKTIRAGACSHSETLIAATIPKGTVELPPNLEKLGSHAFQWCPALTRCNIPHSLKNVGWGVFNSCSNLVPEELSHYISAGENYTSRIIRWLRWREADEKRILLLLTLKVFQDCNEIPSDPTLRFFYHNEFSIREILLFL